MNVAVSRRVVVLGASGLIGFSIATDLLSRGISVVAVARRLTQSQRDHLGTSGKELPIAGVDVMELARLLRDQTADVVVNCLGILQDQSGDTTRDVHDAFVERLIAAIRAAGRPILLVHLSIPGSGADDRTAYSRSKRGAEHRIENSGLPYAILRPGFVLAPAAYGGSALLRSLAALPLQLPQSRNERPMAAVAVEDIAETIAWLARPENKDRAVRWDLMHPDRVDVGAVIGRLRGWLGGPRLRVTIPGFLLDLGARLGDAAALLGWKPPVRTTALTELRRGVAGDPRPWLAATGIEPRSLGDILRGRPADIQEKWFARLFLLKPLVLASLVVFWIVSGLIALTISYKAAVAILTDHGIPAAAAQAMTIASSLNDIAIGLLIAVRRTCRFGLVAGIVVSLGYTAGAAILTPDLWIEPLGALVKTFPAIVLMLVALATLDDR